MALIKTMVSRKLVAGGSLVEQGTWFLDTVTTGNIVPEPATFTPASLAFPVSIAEIEEFSVASDTDDEVTFNLDPATFSPKSVLAITGTSGDTGTYTLRGRPA